MSLQEQHDLSKISKIDKKVELSEAIMQTNINTQLFGQSKYLSIEIKSFEKGDYNIDIFNRKIYSYDLNK